MGLFKRTSPPTSPPAPARTTACLQATPFLLHTVAAPLYRNRAGSLSSSIISSPSALSDNVGPIARDQFTSSSAHFTPAATTLAGRVNIHDIHSSQPVGITAAAKVTGLIAISVNAPKGLVTTAQEHIVLQDDIARQRYNSMNVRSNKDSLKRHYDTRGVELFSISATHDPSSFTPVATCPALAASSAFAGSVSRPPMPPRASSMNDISHSPLPALRRGTLAAHTPAAFAARPSPSMVPAATSITQHRSRGCNHLGHTASSFEHTGTPHLPSDTSSTSHLAGFEPPRSFKANVSNLHLGKLPLAYESTRSTRETPGTPCAGSLYTSDIFFPSADNSYDLAAGAILPQQMSVPSAVKTNPYNMEVQTPSNITRVHVPFDPHVYSPPYTQPPQSLKLSVLIDNAKGPLGSYHSDQDITLTLRGPAVDLADVDVELVSFTEGDETVWEVQIRKKDPYTIRRPGGSVVPAYSPPLVWPCIPGATYASSSGSSTCSPITTPSLDLPAFESLGSYFPPASKTPQRVRSNDTVVGTASSHSKASARKSRHSIVRTPLFRPPQITRSLFAASNPPASAPATIDSFAAALGMHTDSGIYGLIHTPVTPPADHSSAHTPLLRAHDKRGSSTRMISAIRDDDSDEGDIESSSIHDHFGNEAAQRNNRCSNACGSKRQSRARPASQSADNLSLPGQCGWSETEAEEETDAEVEGECGRSSFRD